MDFKSRVGELNKALISSSGVPWDPRSTLLVCHAVPEKNKKISKQMLPKNEISDNHTRALSIGD